MYHFAWPWIFLLLPLPFLFYIIFPAAKQHPTSGILVPHFHQLKQLQKQYTIKIMPNFFSIIAFLIWCLLITAAARPEKIDSSITLPRNGRNIMMAIDISQSMHMPDMIFNQKMVDRLTVVKQVASEFIEQRAGDRIGLILFGSKPYLQTPLTFDVATVIHMLQDATAGLAGAKTAIGDAIVLAIKKLRNLPAPDRILILLTDGANNSGQYSLAQATQLAIENHVKIYTIGIGGEVDPMNLFDEMVTLMNTEVDEKALQEIAKKTGGLFFRAHDPASLQKIYQTIHQIEPKPIETAEKKIVKPLYVFPLGCALFLLSLLLLRRVKVFHVA